ncbi:MAG: AAA family ATPase [Planctomycetaceae bacterium]|nr:AAA family ATPase [Planctomycetaceae bacterium]
MLPTIIEGFWIKNYKGLKQIAFGSSFQQSMVVDIGVDLSPYELTPFTTFIGASGTGKSTILDLFSFISDCLEHGLDEALNRRGGFDAVYHRGGEGPISFGLIYRACSDPSSPLTYAVNIEKKPGSQHAYIEMEALVYRDSQHSGVTPILLFQNGDKSMRHLNPWFGAGTLELDFVKRTDNKHLALAALANYENLPDVPQLKRHLDQFHHACYFPDNAFGLTPRIRKSSKGTSLVAEIKRFRGKHGSEFQEILNVIAGHLPGVEGITCETNESGRQILSFFMTGQDQPFFADQVSEGLLRLFFHVLQFEDPVPIPLIGIEEPAAYMDEEQMKVFVDLARHFVNEKGGTQFLVTTNQITLVDQMDPTEVWILYKDASGDIKSTRALDELSFQGIDLNTVGPYWYSDHVYRKLF